MVRHTIKLSNHLNLPIIYMQCIWKIVISIFICFSFRLIKYVNLSWNVKELILLTHIWMKENKHTHGRTQCPHICLWREHELWLINVFYSNEREKWADEFIAQRIFQIYFCGRFVFLVLRQCYLGIKLNMQINKNI